MEQPQKPVPDIDALLPGTLVDGKVTKILPNGIACKFMKYYDGSVDWFHLSSAIHDTSPIETHFTIGQKVCVLLVSSTDTECQRFCVQIQARIIYVSRLPTARSIGLSMQPHIISCQAPEGIDLRAHKTSPVPIGDIYDSVVVRRVDPANGLLCEVKGLSSPVTAYVHVFHCLHHRPALQVLTDRISWC